jgi:hypothetical protein
MDQPNHRVVLWMVLIKEPLSRFTPNAGCHGLILEPWSIRHYTQPKQGLFSQQKNIFLLKANIGLTALFAVFTFIYIITTSNV